MGANELTPLSEREKEILRLVATGATNQQIARELVISANTVKVHLRNIYAKLGVQSRTEATMVAVRLGWVKVAQAVAEVEAETAGETTPSGPSPAALPRAEPLPRIPIGKRIALIAAMLLATVALFLPQVLQIRARGGAQNPIQDVFPTPTASTASTAGRWRTRAQMPTARNGLAVVEYGGLVFAIGGVDNEGVTSKVEVYDPQANAWAARSSKPTAVGFVQAGVVDDSIYVPGGVGTGQQYQTVLEMYDPLADGWQVRSPLPKPLGAYALAAVGGQIYLFGGFDGQQYVSSVYRYDVQADRWDERKPMAQARAFLAAAALGERIYVAGGFDGQGEFDACGVYDPASDTWTHCAAMQLGRGGLALVAVRQSLYALGGGMDGYVAFNERYDARLDMWMRIETPVTAEWRGLGTAFVKPYIYAIGGWNGSNLSTNEAYQALFQQMIIVP